MSKVVGGKYWHTPDGGVGLFVTIVFFDLWCAGAQLPAKHHSAAAANSSCNAPATYSPAASSSTTANPWCAAHHSTMHRLQSLHLQGCPGALHQLAEWQTRQLHASSSSASRGNSIRAGLDSLQVLQLTHLGEIATALPDVLTGQAALQGCLHSASAGSTSSAIQPWALQHLSQLQISHCRLGAHASSNMLKLSALQQLPALQSLELSHCQLLEVPAAVCACTALTQLNLGHNDIKCLNPQLANLQRLKVGCMRVQWVFQRQQQCSSAVAVPELLWRCGFCCSFWFGYSTNQVCLVFGQDEAAQQAKAQLPDACLNTSQCQHSQL